MLPVVVPFAGVDGKTRLQASREERRELSLAMLGDVLDAVSAVGRPHVVTRDDDASELARDLGATVVGDPGGGQGAAVAAALQQLGRTQVLIVNADVPCVVPADLRTLLASIPTDGLALAEAADGTTNALGLSRAEQFAPLYGSGSAARYRAHAASLGIEAVSVAIANLADDVDTVEDLRRLHSRVGRRTREHLGVEALR